MPLRDTPNGQLGQGLAAALKARVKTSTVSPEVIAANARISLSQLRRILSGERPVNTDQLDLIAASLGLTASAILREAEEATSERPRNPSTYVNVFKQRVNEEGF